MILLIFTKIKIIFYAVTVNFDGIIILHRDIFYEEIVLIICKKKLINEQSVTVESVKIK